MLAMCWAYAGYVLGISWLCAGHMLAMCWACAGYVLGMGDGDGDGDDDDDGGGRISSHPQPPVPSRRDNISRSGKPLTPMK